MNITMKSSKNINRAIWSLNILMGIVIVAGIYFSTYNLVNYHEKVHQAIYEEYGIESKITINKFTLTGITSTTNASLCNEYCTLAHNQNEIVGYHMMGLLDGIWIILVVIFLVIVIWSTLGLIIDNSSKKE